jgi:cell shape-determining protein MreD
VRQVIASDSMYIVLYDLFMLLVALTCYIYHNCYVVLFCLIFVQNLCIVVMCMLVKVRGQFVYVLVRINFLSNQA